MAIQDTQYTKCCPTISKLNVSYKYNVSMGIVKKDAKSFLLSILGKWNEFCKKKLELHVSPFYEVSGSKLLVWQPLFDFDGEQGKNVCLRFYNEQLENMSRNWFVEFTGEGVHLVSRVGYYGFEIEEIELMRKKLKNLFSRYIESLDILSSIRHLPIRRTPSLSSNKSFSLYPISIHSLSSFNSKNDHFYYDYNTFKRIVLHYILPTRILNRKELKWVI